MSLPEELLAIRTTTALCDAWHVITLHVSGRSAFPTLDRICPAPLSLQDTQLRPTVLLREDGTVFADAYVARDDESWSRKAETRPGGRSGGHALASA